MTWSLVCVLPLCGIPAGVLAQSVPAGLRACAAQSDPARRLACYDREMARLSTPPAPALGAPTPPARPASGSAPLEPDMAPRSAPPQMQQAPQTQQTSPTPQATVSTAATPAPANPGASPSHPESFWKIFGGGPSDRVTARVASLDRWPDSMVLHLDNGQVWQQVGRASGDLSLNVGDSVTIEKQLGSYWLSSRHVSGMKVRLKPQ